MKRVSIIAALESRGKYDYISGFFVNIPYGVFPIATKLKNNGYEVRVFAEIVNKKIDWDYVFSSDFIAFSVIGSFCALKTYKYAKMIKKKVTTPIIMGGTHASLIPDECLECCDYVVRGEGDETIIELLDALEKKSDIKNIKGISYLNEDGELVHNPNREPVDNFDDVVDLTLVDGIKPLSKSMDPAEAFIKKGKVYLYPIQSSRGCPFNCDFCLAPREFGRKYRMRSIDSVITDIDNAMKHLNSKTFVLVDNDFAINKARAKELCRRIIDKFGAYNLQIVAFTRIETAQDPELLDLIKKAGFKGLVLGIESTCPEVLLELNKRQTAGDIEKYINIMKSHGIDIWAAIMVGSESDTVKTVRDSLDFVLKKNFTYLGFNALTSALFQTRIFGINQLIPDNRYIHQDWRFYTGSFVCHYPKRMKPSTLQREIIRGYTKFHSVKENLFKLEFLLLPLLVMTRTLRYYPRILMQALPFFSYESYGRIARGIYNVKPIIKGMKKYLPILEKYEQGLYDENEMLIESKLPPVDGIRLDRRIPLDL